MPHVQQLRSHTCMQYATWWLTSGRLQHISCAWHSASLAVVIMALSGLLAETQGPLIEGYTNKVPKVVVGALDATLTSIRSAAAWAADAPQWEAQLH
jgi:hypothetical protein